MSSDIPKARELVDAAIYLMERGAWGDAMRRLREAQPLLTRTVNKKAVKMGNKTTPEIRKRIRAIIAESADFADVEISEMVFGNAGGSGRVSEIRSEMARAV